MDINELTIGQARELIEAVENLLSYMPHGRRYNGPFSFTTDMAPIVIASNTVRGILYQMRHDALPGAGNEDYDNGGNWLNFGDSD